MGNLLPGSGGHLPGTQLIFREILVKFVKLDKVRLTEQGWSLFLTEMSEDKDDSELVSLDLTECWPPDEKMETLENMKAFRIHRDEDVFSLNNNNIRLKKTY